MSQANAAVPKKLEKLVEPAYVPPQEVEVLKIADLLTNVREIPETQQGRLGITVEGGRGFPLWCAGDLSLVRKPCVAVVGAREVSPSGAARARRVSRELCNSGVVVVSGLAKGVDTEAMKAAMEAKGRTIAVIGTPVDKVYPAENRRLQEVVYEEHLLISQFVPGKKTYPSNFPERNKLMAAISDATVIVEASDTSGSLHQAAECLRLNRWLFIAKSLLEDRTLQWPSKFTHYAKTRSLSATKDILDVLKETEASTRPEREGLRNFSVCPHCRQYGREGSWVRIQQDTPILSRSDGRHFHLFLVAGPLPQHGPSGGIVAGRVIAQFAYALDEQSLQRETVDVLLRVLDTRREPLMNAMEDAADKLATVLQSKEALKAKYFYTDGELSELP